MCFGRHRSTGANSSVIGRRAPMKTAPELPEPLAASISKWTRVLRRSVADYLIPYGDPDKRVSPETADAYVARAIEEVGLERLSAVTGETALRALLRPAIASLVAEDERAIARIIEET